jgi:hypothetical protein
MIIYPDDFEAEWAESKAHCCWRSKIRSNGGRRFSDAACFGLAAVMHPSQDRPYVAWS